MPGKLVETICGGKIAFFAVLIGLAFGEREDPTVIRVSCIAWLGGSVVSSKHPAGIHFGASSGACDGTPVPAISLCTTHHPFSRDLIINVSSLATNNIAPESVGSWFQSSAKHEN